MPHFYFNYNAVFISKPLGQMYTDFSVWKYFSLLSNENIDPSHHNSHEEITFIQIRLLSVPM